MGKGSRRRPENIKAMRSNWDAAFGKKKDKPIEYPKDLVPPPDEITDDELKTMAERMFKETEND